jgi:hypothetical protein
MQMHLTGPVSPRPVVDGKWFRIPVVLVAVLLPGCSSREFSVVQGNVSLDGTPLPGVQIIFLSEQGATAVAMSITNAVGEFRMAPVGGSQELSPGTYKVVMSKLPDTSLGSSPTNQPPLVVPAVYTDVATTPLSVKVPASENLTFALTNR